MSWVLIFIAVWMVVAVAAALVIGRGVRLADREAAAAVARTTEWDIRTGATDPADLAAPGQDETAPRRRPAPAGRAHRTVPARRRRVVRRCIAASGRRTPIDRQRGLA